MRLLFAGLLAGALLTAPDVVYAEESAEVAEAHSIENWWSWDYKAKNLPPPFGFALINFTIFVAIMYRFAAPPLRVYLSEQHKTIAKALDEAAALRTEAEAQLTEYQTKIANIDKEIDVLLKTISSEAEIDRQRLIEAAKREASRIRQIAEQQIALEIDIARRELRREVVETAVNRAETLLRSELSAADQTHIADEYVSSVEIVDESAS